MASPSPKKKGGGTILPLLCCCAAATDPGALLSPAPCFPQLPPRGQQARAQSSFSVREAAFWGAGMSKKSTLYRALHDGRPVNSWC